MIPRLSSCSYAVVAKNRQPICVTCVVGLSDHAPVCSSLVGFTSGLAIGTEVSIAEKSKQDSENWLMSGAPGRVAADVAIRRRSQYFRMVPTAEMVFVQGTRLIVSSESIATLCVAVVETKWARTTYIFVELVGVGTRIVAWQSC